jgi:hypothetical protein
MIFWILYYFTLYLLLGLMIKVLGDLVYCDEYSERMPSAFIPIFPVVILVVICYKISEVYTKLIEYNNNKKKDKS